MRKTYKYGNLPNMQRITNKVFTDKDGDAPLSRYLMYVNLDVLTNSRCRHLMGWNNIFDTNLCAGGDQTGGKDSCQVRFSLSLSCLSFVILKLLRLILSHFIKVYLNIN